MTDAPDRDPQAGPEHDAVRRLLADARHDGPTPPAVVARLDEALAALVAERAAEPALHPPVADLGARRRRGAQMGLLAAAAVVVAGVAIGQGLPGPSGEDSGAGSDMATAQESAPEGADDGAGGSTDSQLAPESMKSTAPSPAAGLPSLMSSADALDDQLLVLRGTSLSRGGEATFSGPPVGCGLSGVGPGRRVVAEVDGQVGVVVFGRPSAGLQDVALYVCGDPEPVRTLTLPAP